MLSDVDIQAAMSAGDLTIDPFAIECLRPSSYLLRLCPELLVARDDGGILDTRHTDSSAHFSVHEISSSGYDILPGRFYLGGSVERIGVSSKFAGWLAQLSSMARIGLSVNFSSNLVNATFGQDAPGSITFEILNVAPWPIRVYPGVKFCHLTIYRHEQPARLQYSGIYAGASGARPSDFLRKPSR